MNDELIHNMGRLARLSLDITKLIKRLRWQKQMANKFSEGADRTRAELELLRKEWEVMNHKTRKAIGGDDGNAI